METFDILSRLHGLEAWRRVVYPRGPRTLRRRLSMYTDIHNPPRCAQLADVEEAVEKWEEQLRDYKRCGGSDMPEHEKFDDHEDVAAPDPLVGVACFAELRKLGSVEK